MSTASGATALRGTGVFAEYQLEYEHLPLIDVAAAVPDTTLTLDVGQPNQGGPPPFFLAASGPELPRLHRELDESAFVAEATLITEADAGVRYRLRPALGMEAQLGQGIDDLPGLTALADTDSIIDGIELQPDGWLQRRWFADRAAFRDYWSFWREHARSVTIRRLTETSSGEDPSATLTSAQRVALRTALEMGYFEIPRAASLDDIAAELDISAAALSERLRRGCRQLIEMRLRERVQKGPQQ